MDFRKAFATTRAQSDDIADVPLNDDLGEPYRAKDGSVVTVGLLGPEAKSVLDAEDVNVRRQRREQQVNFTNALFRKNAITRITAALRRWHGPEDADGNPVPFTPENVAEFLATAPAHVLLQMHKGIEEHARFFVTASPS